MIEKVVRTQKLPDYGYIIKDILMKLNIEDPWVMTHSAYNLKGDLIGSPEAAYFLCRTMKIKPETRLKQSQVCSVGFCKSDQKWYGWSHRAIYGFGMGHTVKEGDGGSRKMGVGFTIKTLEDARRVACAFAESVS